MILLCVLDCTLLLGRMVEQHSAFEIEYYFYFLRLECLITISNQLKQRFSLANFFSQFRNSC